MQIQNKKKKQKYFHLQSQFRFDNECYLNLPENHKRVSVQAINNATATTPATSALMLDIDDVNLNALAIVTDGGGNGEAAGDMGISSMATTSTATPVLATGGLIQSKVAVTSAANPIASDEYNFASVSMPYYYFII